MGGQTDSQVHTQIQHSWQKAILVQPCMRARIEKNNSKATCGDLRWVAKR